MLSGAYKRYVLTMLTLVMTLNFTDRVLVILLLQPIKLDLHLSDTQLGFLTGIAFGLFYATLGIPIARLADRGNRVTIASVAIGLWGGTVMLCSYVTTFAQLVAARIAAGVGESGCMPPTYSLLGDYFPAPAERTRATAIYWLGNPISSLIGFGVGGWLSERYGWRMTFVLMGIPGLLVAVVVKLTVSEPRRNRTLVSLPDRLPRMTQVCGALWCQRSSRHLIAAIILLFTVGLGLAPWYGAFMMRSHGMDTAELGVWLGAIFGLGGIAGTWLGGYVASTWFADNEPAQMRLCALLIVGLVPCFALFLLLPQKQQALVALIPSSVIFVFSLGPAFALLQRSVPNGMRATTLAVVMLLANVIGMGVGPQIVGVLSDLLYSRLGADSLRYAMLAMFSVALWASYQFWQVGRTIRDALTMNADRERPNANEARMWNMREI
jgi:predicted MFS family arabinose efflux permease